MYFWSGFHKLHFAFDNMFEQAFVGVLREGWPEWMLNLLEKSAVAAPWLEMATALCLLAPVPLIRNAGVALAMSTHAYILLLVGPLGTDSNVVIWPWNVCMMAVVPLVFCKIAGFGWRELVVTPARYWTGAVVVLVGIMPAFSPGKWDRYLSFHLYSGQGQRLMLVLNDRAVETLPEEVRPFLLPGRGRGIHELQPKKWSYKELKVPFPTEERLNLAMARQFAELPYPRGSLVFFYYDYEFQLQERGWDKFSPGEMLKLEKLGEPRLKAAK